MQHPIPTPTRRGYLKAAAAVSIAALSSSIGAEEEEPEYDVVEAEGQNVELGDGEVYENKLIDLTSGGGITIFVNGADVTIRNIGFKGLYRGGDFIVSLRHASGEFLMENVYLGDGANKDGESFTHGPGAVFMHKSANVDMTFRHCNVQGFPNNAFYCSNTATGGSVTFEECFGKNNGVSTFRCASERDRLVGCVAYNDDTDYSTEDGNYGGYGETNGRPVWAWSPGPVTIEDSHFASGPYDYVLDTDKGGHIEFESGAFEGDLKGGERVTVADGVGDNPDLSIPDGVPTSAEEAASAGLEEEEEEDPWDGIVVIENTGDEPVSYYLEVDEGELRPVNHDGSVIAPDRQWSEDMRASGEVHPEQTHAWGYTGELVDTQLNPEDGAELNRV